MGVLFFRTETVSKNSWGFPKPHSSGGQASSDIISSDGAQREGHAQGSPKAALALLREMGELMIECSEKQEEHSETVLGTW